MEEEVRDFPWNNILRNTQDSPPSGVLPHPCCVFRWLSYLIFFCLQWFDDNETGCGPSGTESNPQEGGASKGLTVTEEQPSGVQITGPHHSENERKKQGTPEGSGRLLGEDLNLEIGRAHVRTPVTS